MRKRLLIAAAVAAVLAILAVFGGHVSLDSTFSPHPLFSKGSISETASHQIPELDHVASALAGTSTTVNCWSEHGWTQFQAWQSAHDEPIDDVGVTFPEESQIELSPFVCQVLGQLLSRSAAQPLFTAYAITVLAHESAHASGIQAENRAECRAIRTEPRAAHLLGVPRAVALRFQHMYRGTIYPHDRPRYRTPACKSGLPGVVVPDTLGTSLELRPLERPATALTRVLPGWRNNGGEAAYLSPCSPIEDRTEETARFGEILRGPHDESVEYLDTRLRTRSEFATAVARNRALPACDLALERKMLRESHSAESVSNGRVPEGIARLSPHGRVFRELWTTHGKRWDRDSFSFVDRADRTLPEIVFRVPVGRLSPALELRAAEAVLHALGHSS